MVGYGLLTKPNPYVIVPKPNQTAMITWFLLLTNAFMGHERVGTNYFS